jgi:hypothetical protein
MYDVYLIGKFGTRNYKGNDWIRVELFRYNEHALDSRVTIPC